MRAGLRATLAIFVGLFALVSGIATSVVHVIGEGASGTDYTGVLAAAAGGDAGGGRSRHALDEAGSSTGKRGATAGAR